MRWWCMISVWLAVWNFQQLPAVTSWADVRCHPSLSLFLVGMFSHFSDNSGPETEGFAAFTMDGPPRKRYSMA